MLSKSQKRMDIAKIVNRWTILVHKKTATNILVKKVYLVEVMFFGNKNLKCEINVNFCKNVNYILVQLIYIFVQTA